MKNLLILAAFAAGGYGLYQYMDTFTPAVDAVNPANQLREGKAAESVARGKMAQATVDTMQQNVNGFRDLNGRFPTSLEELVEKKLIDAVPPGLSYDPASGTVSAN